jgi:hypothetical protein
MDLEKLLWGPNYSLDHDMAFLGLAGWGLSLLFSVSVGLSKLRKLSGVAGSAHSDSAKKALRIATLFVAFCIMGFALPFSISAARQFRGIYFALPAILFGLALYSFFLYTTEIKRLNSAVA